MIDQFIIMLLVLLLILIVIHNINNKTEAQIGYKNCSSNGKEFKEDYLKMLREKRRINNPYDEPVGVNNERCQFCGSTDIDKNHRPATPFMFIEKYEKRCHCCNRVIEED